MIIAACILGLCIIGATIIFCVCLQELNTDERRRKAMQACLIELVSELNDKFPGSTLMVEESIDDVKVTGELKYFTKNGD